MTFHVDAIYEGGVLKPLEPLVLPEQARVSLTVEATASDASESEILAKQKAALQEAWDEIQVREQHRNNDGWSVRDHDDLLYGGEW